MIRKGDFILWNSLCHSISLSGRTDKGNWETYAHGSPQRDGRVSVFLTREAFSLKSSYAKSTYVLAFSSSCKSQSLVFSSRIIQDGRFGITSGLHQSAFCLVKAALDYMSSRLNFGARGNFASTFEELRTGLHSTIHSRPAALLNWA